MFEKWNSQCTHLLLEEASSVTDLVTAAILSRKPVLLLEWLQVSVFSDLKSEGTLGSGIEDYISGF